MATIYEKQLAQENLLSAMQVAFDRLNDEEMDSEKLAALHDTMSKQMERVEKLFGYTPHSFTRGC